MLAETSLYREFAVDPQILNSVEAIRKCLAFFGWEKGNIICAIPSREKWYEYVCEASQLPLDKIQDLLNKDFVIERICNPRENFTNWTECALYEHNRRPFKAILHSDNSSIKDIPVNWDELINYDEYFWETHKIVPRESEKLSSSIELLLLSGPHITFVDPHFQLEERFLKTLKCMLKKSYNRLYSTSSKKFYLHCQYPDCLTRDQKKDSSRFPELDENSTDEKKKYVLSELKKEFKPQLEKILHVKDELSIYFWIKSNDRAWMHNRYVFSRTGGVMFGWGLDQCMHFTHPQDDVAILSKKAHDKYNEMYLLGNNLSKILQEKKTYFLTFTIEEKWFIRQVRTAFS